MLEISISSSLPDSANKQKNVRSQILYSLVHSSRAGKAHHWLRHETLVRGGFNELEEARDQCFRVRHVQGCNK
jgi:hypothetical protein